MLVLFGSLESVVTFSEAVIDCQESSRKFGACEVHAYFLKYICSAAIQRGAISI